MKTIIIALLLICSSVVNATEIITVLNPQGPTHSGTPQLLAVISEANKMQDKYQFIMEIKTGAFESIAINSLSSSPNSRLSTITNASYEGFSRELASEDSIVPVFSQGDSCWAVIGITSENKGLESFREVKEIVVGGPAIGGATHLAALEIGRRYNKPVRYIVYKSNFDAFVNMVADGSINFILERVKNYDSFKSKNPNLHMLSMSCPARHPAANSVKTLKEYNIHSPYIWQHIVAHKSMDPAKVAEFENIFTLATKKLGQLHIQDLSDQTPAIFQGIDSKTHYRQSLSILREYRKRFDKEIEAAR